MKFAPQHNVNSMLIHHRPTPTIPNHHQKSNFMNKIQCWIHLSSSFRVVRSTFIEVKMIAKWWRMVEEWAQRTYPASATPMLTGKMKGYCTCNVTPYLLLNDVVAYGRIATKKTVSWRCSSKPRATQHLSEIIVFSQLSTFGVTVAQS